MERFGPTDCKSGTLAVGEGLFYRDLRPARTGRGDVWASGAPRRVRSGAEGRFVPLPAAYVGPLGLAAPRFHGRRRGARSPIRCLIFAIPLEVRQAEPLRPAPRPLRALRTRFATDRTPAREQPAELILRSSSYRRHERRGRGTRISGIGISVRQTSRPCSRRMPGAAGVPEFRQCPWR